MRLCVQEKSFCLLHDLQELKDVKDNDDLEVLKSKNEQLVQSSLKLGEAIYKQNPPEGSAPENAGEEPSSDKKDDKVVDADFEEVDEDKKD